VPVGLEQTLDAPAEVDIVRLRRLFPHSWSCPIGNFVWL
jgi:hypothetical protein